MCLIITIYILFINAYYISSFTPFYIDLLTIDVILLNLSRCLLFFDGGWANVGGHMSGGINVGGGGQMSGGGMSGYHIYCQCMFNYFIYRRHVDYLHYKHE